jgi:glycosyltransferase involved in cell wall biosynthesis
MLASIILPCRNEEKAVGRVINQIKEVINKNNIKAEIIVSDSSKDNSADIAKRLGARVIKHNKKGYGIALIEGLSAAQGQYLFFADCDGTYDFRELPKFIKYLEEGYDFVIGNRKKIENGAMPFLHRYFGNPALSCSLRLFFNANIKDAHCGMRALTKEAFEKMELRTTGMEFASEMIIKAIKQNLRIKQVPINYHRRIGKSKLSSFSDGWRHLRFMLMYAPDYLFTIPGLFSLLFGILIMAMFLAGPIQINGLKLYTHPMIIGSFLTIVGYQIVTLGIYAKTYAVSAGLEKKDRLVETVARFVTFESGIVFGLMILLISFVLGLMLLIDWIIGGFPGIMKTNLIILILTLGIIGVQTMFSSFFLSVLLVERK